MFGYVRFHKPEMKIKDYESYRAVYCSLCKKMGKDYGILSRFTLSYDFTFLSVLNMAVNNSCSQFKGGRCTFNPLKKCNYCSDLKLLSLPSATSVISLYGKLSDNVYDSKGLKKLCFKTARLFFKHSYKKASKEYPRINLLMEEYLSSQSLLEKENETSVDKAAEPTAKFLASLFAMLSEDKTQKRVLERMGYCVGRYIYILDAACDFTEDKKYNNYNVFKFDCNNKEDVVKRATPLLYNSINEATLSFELLKVYHFKDVLGNVLYLGLEETFLKELKNE